MWTFDGNLNDFYGIFNAGPDNGRTATYVYPGYTGYGGALSLGLHGTSQSVSIATFLSIWHVSFTLEAWIYPTAFSWTYGGSPDNALFGQCQSQSTDRCLHIILRSQRIYFGFYGDDLQGNIAFQANQWYHVAYAYDQSTRQQYTGTSYYQFQGLTYFGHSGWSYSISLWIYPLSSSGGTIVHASGGYGTDGVGNTGWCLPMLGFSSSGALYAQTTSSTSTLIVLTGPTVTLNSWTYVTITYSTTNGLRLYTDSTLQSSSTTAFTFISSGSPNTITLGNGLSGASSIYCPQGSITSAQYQGYIDSFSLYSRELTTANIATLYTTPQP
ncbi:unnamed protein product [Rotaria sordida]|uniref:Uncharacterized protein n=1 Tax=Rotaria sordida TaxID=392033 RepID=A0A819EK12_9BILA|nr:unnamed protein product [Rotaria sordida]